MIHLITFDTLAFVKKLEAAEMQPKQAEAVATAIKDVFDENLSPLLFTKHDGKLLENKIDLLDKKFSAKLLKLKSELIMWMVGLLFAQSAILISIIKFIQ
jgi:hypothetical protein